MLARMGHNCGHHHHSHDSIATHHRAFAIGALLNAVYVVAELVAGWWTHSLALSADALHNLGDVLALLLAWAGYALAFRKPTPDFTYGLGRVSIYATLVNGITLVGSSLWILYEAILRFSHPVTPETGIVMAVASVGIVINTATAWLLARGRHDINIRATIWHMLADAGISAGVVVTAFAISLGGGVWLDPLVSVLIALVIVWGGWPILREGLRLSLDAVPQQTDAAGIRDFLHNHPDLAEVHDLHIWALATDKTALSAHLMIRDGAEHEHVLRRVHRQLNKNFGITHVTLQIERDHSACTDQHETVEDGS